MFKRIIAVALAALLLVSMAVIAVSAADGNESAGADANNSAGADTNSEASGASNVVKFDPSGIWSNINTVYCHIWPIGKDSFYGWQANAEKCEKVGATYQYDLDKLNDSDYISGGLQSGVDYCIIFSADTGVETYGCTFGPDCAGDTLYLTGNKIENTEDSTKKSDEAVFEDHTNYGPHLAFTSIGNVVGKVLGAHEKGVQIIGDWLPRYYTSTYIDDHVKVLKNALPKCGITTADQLAAVMAYIKSKETGEDEAEMQRMLEEATGLKIDEEKVKEAEKKLDDGESVEDLAEDVGAGGGSGSGSGSDSGSGSGSGSGGGNGSGSGADGQETTLFAVLALVMLGAAGVMFVTRKRED